MGDQAGTKGGSYGYEPEPGDGTLSPFDPPPEVVVRGGGGGRVAPGYGADAGGGTGGVRGGTTGRAMPDYPTMQDYDYTPSWLSSYYTPGGGSTYYNPAQAAGTPQPGSGTDIQPSVTF